MRTFDPHSPSFAKEFLGFLEQREALDGIGIERALEAQRRTGQRIDTVLAELGLVQHETLLAAVSAFTGFLSISTQQFPVEALNDVPVQPEFLRANTILPVAVHDNVLTLAVADPFDQNLLASLAYSLDVVIDPRLAAPAEIASAIDRLYTNSAGEDSKPADGGNFASEDDIQRLKDIASEAPVIKMVNRLISSAASQRASDIHIESMADNVRVRYRIDGAMIDVERFAPDMQAALASRIKIMARLNIAERRLPQDGRMKFVVAGREIDIRVSTAPVLHGESIVMRLLDQKAADLDFPALGFTPAMCVTLADLLKNPNGIILVTGPTGSGKTTTLYASLKKINAPQTKIFTVEDPIEYHLPGVNQMQIKPAIGLDFVQCLRSILRQDPDIIMIGEMRDLETVRIGIQAALTGHLVLSTLHTNSAAASISRLLDMGAEDYLIASTLRGILAQRLVRRLCPRCAQEAPVDAETAQSLTTTLGNACPPRHSWRVLRPAGCGECSQTGFKGRTTICELLLVDADLRREIKRGRDERDLERFAREGGMTSLYQSGVAKVLRGETTLDEVHKAVRS